jgi:hypothetical protein
MITKLYFYVLTVSSSCRDGGHDETAEREVERGPDPVRPVPVAAVV